jgi:ketosteroid isomerase-like protein
MALAPFVVLGAMTLAIAPLWILSANATADRRSADADDVAAVDLAYQAAVRRGDVEAMGRILHQQFFLVLGNGTVISRQELLDSARAKKIEYKVQAEDPGTQAVRVWGDTAVVTAPLWLKGSREGKKFERRLWSSNTYVRTPGGWRYAFAQASSRQPASAELSDL